MRAIQQTYFLTCVCEDRLRRFQTHTNAKIALDTIRHYDVQDKYTLHAAVVMPDHIHALFTPAPDKSLEACVSLIKGGISFRPRDRIAGQLWQESYDDRRIRDDAQFVRAFDYIRDNPEKDGLQDWPFMYLRG